MSEVIFLNRNKKGAQDVLLDGAEKGFDNVVIVGTKEENGKTFIYIESSVESNLKLLGALDLAKNTIINGNYK